MAVFWFVVALSGFATGCGCGDGTVIVTVVVFDVPFDATSLYVNWSVPEKPAFGVYTYCTPLSETLPFAGLLTNITICKVPPFKLSLSKTGIVTGVACGVVALSGLATGLAPPPPPTVTGKLFSQNTVGSGFDHTLTM